MVLLLCHAHMSIATNILTLWITGTRRKVNRVNFGIFAQAQMAFFQSVNSINEKRLKMTVFTALLRKCRKMKGPTAAGNIYLILCNQLVIEQSW